jgi:prefoldin alpha subunit
MSEENFLQYQNLMEQLKLLQNHLSQLERHVESLKLLESSLEELQLVEAGQEMLLPLGAGIFFKGVKSKDNKILMAVGADVCVERDFDEAKESVHKQIEELQGVLSQMQINLTYLSTKEREMRASLHSHGEPECNC